MTTQFTKKNGKTYKVRINRTTKVATFWEVEFPGLKLHADMIDDDIRYYCYGCPTANDWQHLLSTAY